MNVDRYTKVVLTVIAGCLLWMCAMGAGSPIAAQARSRVLQHPEVQPVVIVGTGTLDQDGQVTVSFVQRAGRRVTDPTVPVALPYSLEKPLPVSLPFYTTTAPLPIEITAVRKTGEWEPIRASVEDAPTRKLPGGGR